MNKDERRYRFTEIMSALEMLPELCEIPEHLEVDCDCYGDSTPDTWKLPNGSRGIEDSSLRDAIICQILKRNDDNFTMKSVGVFLNTAMTNIMESNEPSDNDLELMATTANILWAVGNASGLFNALGMLGRICMSTDKEVPEIATIVLKGNRNAKVFGNLDPYKLLDEGLTRKEMLDILRAQQSSADEADDE